MNGKLMVDLIDNLSKALKKKMLSILRVLANQSKIWSCILSVVLNYHIGPDTYQSSQIVSGLSEFQSCFRQLLTNILGPK